MGRTILAAILAFYAGVVFGQEPAGVVRLTEADVALFSGDLPGACAIWEELSAADSTVGEVARYRWGHWVDQCPLPDAFPTPPEAVASLRGSAVQIVAQAALWRQWASRTGRSELANALREGRLAPVFSGYQPIQAPTLWTFAATSWPDRDVAGDGLGNGGLAWQRYCFDIATDTTLSLRVTFPNPGRALLDGQELLLIGPDVGARFPVVRMMTLRLEAGRHELRTLQGIVAAQSPVELDLLPADLVKVAPCGATPATWSTVAPTPLPENAYLADWLRLARGTLTEADLQRLAAQALDGVEHYLLYRSALLHSGLPILRKEDLQRELAGSFLAQFDACLPRLDLADSALSAGERDAARTLIDEASESCLNSANGLLLQAEMARWMQWSALLDRYLDTAFQRYPDNCLVQERVLERQRERGVALSPLAHPCKQAKGLLEAAAVRQARSVNWPSADTFEEQFKAGSAGLRDRLLGGLAARLDDPAWQPIIDRLIAAEPQVAWGLADALFAAGKTSLARDFARRSANHMNSWEALRTQAGRMLYWSDLRRQQVDVATLIDRYLEDGFSAGSPQVVVLDEAIARPGSLGWLTLAETTVLHVASPDAAEAIGEVTVGSDEEIVELAIRKADGRWFGPVHPDESNFKETLSLAGLATGDFIVRRSIREVALQDGSQGCASLPTFYFTPREAPVFLSRYVLIDPERRFQIVSGGDVWPDHRDDTVVVEMGGLEPVPIEPRCPEPEAGLTWVQPVPLCASWDRLRDRVGDALLGYCNATPDVGRDPSADTLYRWTLKSIQEDGTGLFNASYRDILTTGSGNRVLALYCALVQHGFDAHIVAAHSPAAPAINWRRPALTSMDGMLVYVAGAQGRWYDPYDATVTPGYLRPALRSRPAMVLTPRYPRLFLSTPAAKDREGWSIALEVDVSASGELQGKLALEATGDAAAGLARQTRSGGDDVRTRLAESILHMMFPGQQILRQQFEIVGHRVVVRVDFAGTIDVRDSGQLVLRLPPLPSQDLVQLAQRSSPLYYAGVLPLTLDATLRFDRELRWKVPEGIERIDTDFATVALAVEADRRTLRVTKKARALPQRIEASRYPEFLQTIMGIHRLKLLPIEVRHEDAP